MQHNPTYRVTGPVDCPMTQSVELALALRGLPVRRQIGSRTLLVIRQDEGVLLVAEGGVAIFDLIDRLDPGKVAAPQDGPSQQKLAALAFDAAPALEQVIAARNLRDLDLGIYVLRKKLVQIEAQLADLADAPASQMDAALLPLFWRIALLDLRHQAHLGDGLWHWTRRSGRMLRDPRFALHFDRVAGRKFLERLIDQGSALACDPRYENWDGAFAALRPERAAAPITPALPKIKRIHYQTSRV